MALDEKHHVGRSVQARHGVRRLDGGEDVNKLLRDLADCADRGEVKGVAIACVYSDETSQTMWSFGAGFKSANVTGAIQHLLYRWLKEHDD